MYPLPPSEWVKVESAGLELPPKKCIRYLPSAANWAPERLKFSRHVAVTVSMSNAKTLKITAERDRLTAERVRLERLLKFCPDQDTRQELERVESAIAGDLGQFRGLVQLAQPRALVVNHGR